MKDQTLIGIWSGPRHGASELLYACGQRQDTEAIDRPFMGYHLRVTGNEHPDREEILDSMSTHAPSIINHQLLAPQVQPIRSFRMMTHHLMGADLNFVTDIPYHILIIRRPKEVFLKMQSPFDNFASIALSYEMQFQFFKYLTGKGINPLVIDANMMHEEPKSALQMICSYCEITFDPVMMERGPMAYFTSVYESHDLEGENTFHAKGILNPQNDLQEAILEECRATYLNMLEYAKFPQCPQTKKLYKVA